MGLVMNGDFIPPNPTTETPPRPHLLWVCLAAMVLFAGLCSIFALVVTAAEAWQEHAQQQWPHVTARVESCDLEQTSSGERHMYHIRCRLSYNVDGERNVANTYSGNAPAAGVWQYPPNQIGPLEQWVEKNPAGTPIDVRYDPAHHTKVVLVHTDMPRGGRHSESNIRVLELFAGSFVILLTIVRITRPRAIGQARG
jgi:hypothetical protein